MAYIPLFEYDLACKLPTFGELIPKKNSIHINPGNTWTRREISFHVKVELVLQGQDRLSMSPVTHSGFGFYLNVRNLRKKDIWYLFSKL
jgi:hypothetical protein